MLWGYFTFVKTYIVGGKEDNAGQNLSLQPRPDEETGQVGQQNRTTTPFWAALKPFLDDEAYTMLKEGKQRQNTTVDNCI